MLLNRRKTDRATEMSSTLVDRDTEIFDSDYKKTGLFDILKLLVFCLLLAVPVYAIALSAIRHDWTMMIIDALLVPVGFVHGLLLLFGYVA